MDGPPGLRERKRAQTRERIADAAAALFAERGYDAVSVLDVAHAADVSDQTVYNYFPTKQGLVLDRVDEYLDLYEHAVLDRRKGASPARALHPLVEADIERYRHADPRLARGEFPSQCVDSAVLRRFALEFRARQTDVVSDAITGTSPTLHPLVAHAHAAALVSVTQTVTDRIGASILAGGPSPGVADELSRDAAVAFDDLDRTFRSMLRRSSPTPPAATSGASS